MNYKILYPILCSLILCLCTNVALGFNSITYETSCTPVAPSGSMNQYFCLVDHPTVSELQANGSNIQWYETATSVIPINLNVFLESGQDYFATQTENGCESTDRLQVLIFLDDPGTPTGDNVQEFCLSQAPTIAHLMAVGSNIQWYSSNTSPNALNPNIVLESGSDYYATQSNGACESDIRMQVIVLIEDAPPATGDQFQTFCLIDNATINDLVASGMYIQWYLNETSNVPLQSNVTLVEGEDYYATQTIGACESSQRFQVIVSMNDTPAPTIGNALVTYCHVDDPTVGDLQATGINIQWYPEMNSDIPLNPNVGLVNGGDYFATQTINGCESINRLQILVTFENPEPPQAPTGDGIVTYCLVDEATVGDLITIGTNIQWYEDETEEIPLDPATLLLDGEDYFATQSEGGCESSERLEINVVLEDPTPPTTSDNYQYFCSTDNATISDLAVIGTAVVWYQDEISNIPLSPNIALQDGADYYATQTVDNCESSIRLQVDVIISSVPNISLLVNPVDMAICGSGSTFIEVSDTETDVEYQLINATSGATIGTPIQGNGGVVSLATGNLTSTTFFQIESISTQDNNCSASLISQVTVVVDEEPSTAAAGNDFVVCNQSTFNLNANAPMIGTGTWSLVSGDNSISIDNPNANDSSVSNLSAGTFVFQWEITNGACSGLLASTDVVTVQVSEILLNTTLTATSIVDGNDGIIGLCIEGGTAPFNIIWTPSSVGSLLSATSVTCPNYFEISGLPSGTYDIGIEDDNGCTSSLTNIAVLEPDCSSFEITNLSFNNESCSENNDGSITIQTTDGEGDIIYEIGNSIPAVQSNNPNFTFNNLEEGTYNVIITDERLCEYNYSTSIIITAPNELEGNMTVSHPTALGSTDGAICVTVIGGTAPYTVTSSCGTFLQGTGICGGDFFLENLGNGTCTVNITDANNCSYAESLTLSDPSCDDFVISSVTTEDLFCKNDGSGSIQILVNSGMPPYQYSIDGGSTFTTDNTASYQFNDLDAGTYIVTVVDQIGCSVTYSNTVAINEPSSISIDLSNFLNDCFDLGQGNINPIVSGGTPDYNFAWSNGTNTALNEGLSPGDYTLTVSDMNGCTASANATIFNAPEFSAEIQVNGLATTSTSFNVGESVEMTVVTDTNNPIIEWSPSDGLSNNNTATVIATPTETTEYMVTVTSEEGCAFTMPITVNVSSEHSILLPTAFSPNGDDHNDGFYPIELGITTIQNFKIYNRWGQLIHDDKTMPWDGTFKGEKQAIDTYVYVITYDTFEETSITVSGDFILIR